MLTYMLMRYFFDAGPAEFSVTATTALMLPGVQQAPIGSPDANVRAYVVNQNMIDELQPVGVIGELLLSGPRIALGYINNNKETIQRFVKNPFNDVDTSVSKHYEMVYRTGDLVSWDSFGELHFHGRSDGQVKINGVRIELSEVEFAIRSHPEVISAHVIPLENPENNKKTIVAFVTPAKIDQSDVLDKCSARLIPAAVPSHIICLDALPLSDTGKTNEKKLIKLAELEIKVLDREHSESWYVAPQTSTEEIIAGIAQEVLHYPDDISVEGNFFHLGGNSLRAGILSARLRKQFDLPNIPATIVYQQKTIRNIASAVDKLRDGSKENGVQEGGIPELKLQADKDLKLLPAQVVKEKRLPYWLYLIIQYIMLSLTMVMVPVIWGSLLVALLELRPIISSWWLILIWPSLQVGALFGYALLLILLKWVLVGRLKPGVYPVYGWMYARWVTMRALQESAGATFLPAIRRTPFLSLLYKALGAKVESCSDVLFDSIDISDFDMLSFGKGACIYSNASIKGAFVAPSGYLGTKPVLVLSEVDIGKNCHIGHHAVVTGGTCIPEGHNLKPHASRAHPGDAPVAGPLSDFPHFVAEERLGATSSLLSTFSQI